MIEYMIRQEEAGELVGQSVSEFCRSVADRTTAPGGGSVGAVVAALGSALASMVAKLSYGKKMFEQNDPLMRTLVPPLHRAVETMLPLVDADTQAFTEYSEATRLPNGSEEERAM